MAKCKTQSTHYFASKLEEGTPSICFCPAHAELRKPGETTAPTHIVAGIEAEFFDKDV
jgi:hypothetical protein